MSKTFKPGFPLMEELIESVEIIEVEDRFMSFQYKLKHLGESVDRKHQDISNGLCAALDILRKVYGIRGKMAETGKSEEFKGKSA